MVTRSLVSIQLNDDETLTCLDNDDDPASCNYIFTRGIVKRVKITTALFGINFHEELAFSLPLFPSFFYVCCKTVYGALF